MVYGDDEIQPDDELDQLNKSEGGISCSHDMFKELEKVNTIIARINTVILSEIKAEKDFEDLKTTFDEYQEQPHLLDPHLEGLLEQLIGIVRNPSHSTKILEQTFKYLWLISKVRGYKTVARKLPHEVKDLIPVLEMLEKAEFNSDFYACYVLLMWLSIIVYMPFDMNGFDQYSDAHNKSISSNNKCSKQQTIVERILEVIQNQLKSSLATSDMAAYLASKFVTRPDLKDKFLPNFISYCYQVLENTNVADHKVICGKLGVLRALGLIFKHGKREELSKYSEDLLSKVIALNLVNSDETKIRKYSIKLIQRIGLSFLKPVIASWRYQMGNRSLMINIDNKSESQSNWQNTEEEEGEDGDISTCMEDIIDNLLLGLKDRDTIVRWSSAKGIGRVTGRLPKEFADDVVGAILELFSVRESDKAWHGGCLALAELARRSLLLPERLPAVLPILEKALVYDEQRGQCSVGSNIRDAACYLCWAFARAYHPSQLEDYVKKLATGLLIVSLFDREIPCRRAGSAAFQEHVGRQGSFPHGIKILTTVDYFAVGIRSNAFLKLSMEVAKYEEYTIPLIDHLVEKKIGHWDSVIRELTANALQNLTALALDYMTKTILPKLLEQTSCPMLILRHGSILAIGHILYGIKLVIGEDKPIEDFVDKTILSDIKNIVPTLSEKKLYRGLGGEYMKQASCVLIEKSSLAKLPFHQDPILGEWLPLLEECAVYVEENIRIAALEALPAMWSTYYLPLTESNTQWRNDLIQRYVTCISGDKEIVCLGSSASLGCVPYDLLKGKLDVVLNCLMNATKITSSTATWAIGRKVAITSILKIVERIDINANGPASDYLCRENVIDIYKCLLSAMEDYTMDRRGDIGALVREAAMTSLEKITVIILEKDISLLDESIISEMLAKICQQAVERIDRTRKVAGFALSSLLHRDPALPYIPHKEEIEEIFTKETLSSINWASESKTFTYFVQFLDFPPYRYKILLGLTYSLGGISANLSRYANEAILEYLNDKSENDEAIINFINTILDLFKNYEKEDRIIVPLIKSLGLLLSSSTSLDSVFETNEELLSQLLSCLKKESTKCSDYHKLCAIVSVLCELLRIESSFTKAILTQLSLFLGYQFPKVRANTASLLLTALQDYCDKEIVPNENFDEVNSILEDTEWIDNIEEARVQRNKFCVLVGIPYPKPKKKP